MTTVCREFGISTVTVDKIFNRYKECGLEALNGACPGELNTPSPRVYQPPADPDYPFHDRTVRVTRCGRICLGRRKINLSNVFAGR